MDDEAPSHFATDSIENSSFLFGVSLKGRLFLERECSTTIQDIGTLIILFGEFLQGSILASYLLPGGEATDLLVAAHLLSQLETGKKTHHVNGKLLMDLLIISILQL